MLLSPWHRQRENASGETWAGHGGFCLVGSRSWEGSKGLASSKGSPHFQRETPTGNQAVQACFAQASRRR